MKSKRTNSKKWFYAKILAFAIGLTHTSQAAFVEGPPGTYINAEGEITTGFNITNVSATVINYGTVSNSGAGSPFGILSGPQKDTVRNIGSIICNNFPFSIGVSDIGGNNNSLENYGTIEVDGNIGAIGMASINGTNSYIQNFGTINTIATGIGVAGSGNALTINNSGTLKGDPFAVVLPGGSTIINKGTLNGQINGSLGNDVVINYGSISNVTQNLSDGTDRIVLKNGAQVIGVMDGSTNSDTLVFSFLGMLEADKQAVTTASAAGGTLTLMGQTYQWTNFESLVADSATPGLFDLALQQKTSLQAVGTKNGATITSNVVVGTLASKKDKPVAFSDFNNDGLPDLVTANKSSVKVLTGAGFSMTLATLTLGKGEKVIVSGDVSGDANMDLLVKKGKRVSAYVGNGAGFEATAVGIYTNQGGFKVVGAGVFGKAHSVVLKKGKKYEYRDVSKVGQAGTALTLPSGYKQVIGVADFVPGGDWEILSLKGKKVGIGTTADVYTLPKKTKLIGPR